jgi:PAS domain S-box-containing protein
MVDPSDFLRSPRKKSLLQRRQFVLAFPIFCLVATLAAFSWLEVETTKAEYLGLRTGIEQFLTEAERSQVERDRVLHQQPYLTWMIFSLSAGIGMGGSLLIMYLMYRLERRLDQRLGEQRQAEETLRRSEKTLRLVLENMPVMLDVFDAGGNIVVWNQECERVTGYSANEIVGNPQAMAMLYPDATYRQQMMSAWMEHGNNYRDWEWDITCKDGSLRTVAWSNISDRFPIAGWVAWGIGVDVTERKRAEESLRQSEERYRCLVTATSQIVWTTDEHGHNTSISSPWVELTGQPQEEIQVWAWLDHIHPDDRDRARKAWSHAMETQTFYEAELRLQTRDGNYRDFWMRSIPVIHPNGNVREWIGIGTDISLLKQAEEALRQVNQELETHVAERTAELRQTNDRLQEELLERLRTQQVLQEQAQLLDLAHDTIIARDLNNTITFWNKGAEQMYGWTKSEAWGKEIRTLLQTQFPQPVAEIEAEFFSGGYWAGELIHIKRDGTPIVVASRWALQQDNQGRPIKILEINNDITEHKRAEEARSRLAAIVESSDDAIISITLDGVIMSWNAGAEKLFGYTAEEMIGLTFNPLLPPDRPDEEAQILQQLQQGEQIKHYETVRQCKDGKLLDISLTVSPMKNPTGEIVGISKIARDITARKQDEEQLRLSAEHVSLANSELARAARLKDEFLAGMSHELRTPLNTILGLSEALLEEVYGDLTEKQQQSLKTIEQSGKHLLDLINDILDLSKIESGKMELQMSSVSIQTLGEFSLSFVRQQAHRKNIKLGLQVTDNPKEIWMDDRRIRQVLINLLSNAVKFTSEGGEVHLQVKADAAREVIEFSVRDTGIGIASEDMTKLFRPFVQLDSSLSRRYGGTGLGLALVRRITELHDGSVSVRSDVGQGSCFTVTLPWKPTNSATVTTSEDELAESESPNTPQAFPKLPLILLVEDNEAIIATLADYFQCHNLQLVPARNGLEAIQTAQQYQLDLILMDIQMPGMDGLEAIRRIRADAKLAHIPIIALTALAMPGDRDRCLQAGAVEYLTKPVSLKQLLKAISDHVSIGK